MPTEFCLVDGVPDSIRKGAGMRDALAQTRIDPKEKLRRIQQMVHTLFSQKAVKDWDITVEESPVHLQTQIMEAPKMLTPKQIIACDDNALRKNTILKAAHLEQERWIMVYEKSDRVYKVADNIYNDLCKASKQLGLKVEEPYWIELSKETNRQQLEEELCEYIGGNGQYRHPTIVLFVLQRENNYEMYKEVMLKYEILS